MAKQKYPWTISNIIFSIILSTLAYQAPSYGFCGFFVAKAGAKLFNKSSQVVLVRDADKTVLTMGNDYQGDSKSFALVVPVPTILKKKQIRVGEQSLIDRIDGFTAPRLAEYFEDDPCQRAIYEKSRLSLQNSPSLRRKTEKKLGVTIEAQYTIGEYDILILSAKESSGLLTWLNQNDYHLPKDASPILRSYIKQELKFFVAKVNLARLEKSGRVKLRPLQIAYESPRFMLPIRLGTVNSQGFQELFVYAITKKGRIELVNYKTKKLPSNIDIPVFIKKDFKNFYRDMFAVAWQKENQKSAILEYAWDMNWCDPCAENPLNKKELRDLGVFWISKPSTDRRQKGNAQPAYVTRLHLRYNKSTFPEDLIFKSTQNKKNFQGRFVIRNKWRGKASCDAAETYKNNLVTRKEQEAKNLANLTGWEISEIRKKMNIKKPKEKKSDDWLDNLWK
ncbi:MAG: DUF2330 domain-containing protein [Oligoflexales bacterium]